MTEQEQEKLKKEILLSYLIGKFFDDREMVASDLQQLEQHKQPEPEVKPDPNAPIKFASNPNNRFAALKLKTSKQKSIESGEDNAIPTGSEQ